MELPPTKSSLWPPAKSQLFCPPLTLLRRAATSMLLVLRRAATSPPVLSAVPLARLLWMELLRRPSTLSCRRREHGDGGDASEAYASRRGARGCFAEEREAGELRTSGHRCSIGNSI
jgi:hypothetical protein